MGRSRQLVFAVLVVLVAGTGVTVGVPAGAVAPPPPKAISLTASRQTAVYSQAVKLSLALTPKGGGSPKGGTVTFLVDGTPIGTATATTRNTALTTSAIPPGNHDLGATYSGDAVTAPATSPTVPITITAAPTTLGLGGDGYVPEGQRPEIKAFVRTVAPAATSRRPNGRVSFTTACGSGSVAVNSNGVATWRPLLCPGERTVTATYDGTDRWAPSGPVSITVAIGDTVGVSAVDQENPGPSAGGAVSVVDDVDSRIDQAQIFTAGVTGEIDAVDLWAFWVEETGTPRPLLASIQTVDGDPTGTIVAHGSLDASGSDPARGASHIVLETHGFVQAGTQYALVIDTEPQPEGVRGGWYLDQNQAEAYPGAVYERYDDGAWELNDQVDILFRTWVIPTTVSP